VGVGLPFAALHSQVSRARLALLAVPVVLLACGGCRDSSSTPSPTAPAGSVEQRLDDIESTLDGIESELNEG
jgi:hypothetical protein